MDTQQELGPMQPDEYRDAIKALDFTQEGFAELLGAKPRTGQYWASVSVPPAVATIVRLLQTRPELRTVLEELHAARIDKGERGND